MAGPQDANGFKDTDIGPIPVEWEVMRLGAVFKIQQGKSLSRKYQQGISPYPFLRTANVRWGRIDLSKVDEMDFTNAEVEKYALRPRDLLVCEGGEIGRTAIWQLDTGTYCYQNHLHRLRPTREDILPLFYMYWMQAAFLLLNTYHGVGVKTTIANLSRSRLSRFLLPKPPPPEQRRIAHVLSTIQRAIAAQGDVIAAAKETKRSLMHRLFTYGPGPEPAPTRETEIGEIPEHWEVVPLGDLIEIASGQVDPRVLPYRKMVHIGPADIEEGTGRVLSPKTAEELGLKSGKYQFTPDDVVYSKIRPYLRKAMLPDFTGICSADMYPLRPKGRMSDRRYLYYLLLSDIFTQQAVPHQQRTGIPKINRNQLRSVYVPLPGNGREQSEIADMLDSIERKIGAEQQRKAALQALFQSMLQQLMTGQLRISRVGAGLKPAPTSQPAPTDRGTDAQHTG